MSDEPALPDHALTWAQALTDATALRAQGCFLVEGRLGLARVLAGAAGGPDAIVAVLGTPAAARALDLERRMGGRLVVRTPTEMEALTGFNFHRGVLAVVRRPPMLAVRDVIAAAVASDMDAPERRPYPAYRNPKPGTRHPVLVVAEHLVDVDNVGSCFRNARAFGAAGVLLDVRCPDPLYRKAVRTSMGHVLEVPWAQAPIGEILVTLHEHGVATIGLTPHRDLNRRPAASLPGPLGERPLPTTFTDSLSGERALPTVVASLAGVSAAVSPAQPVAVVIGNEGSGLTEATMAGCTHLARLPMAEGADSLNVATALAVALYELTQSRDA